MPPGLRLQVWVAVAITAAALVLPTALKAGGDAAPTSLAKLSAGTISTSTRDFSATDFPASAFTDWES